MKATPSGNIYRPLPDASAGEVFEPLTQTAHLLLERIVSQGQATPPGQWLIEEREEWVILLQGAARLRLHDEAGERTLAPGDWCRIPAGRRHRVEWTVPDAPTVWLALHHEAQHDET